MITCTGDTFKRARERHVLGFAGVDKIHIRRNNGQRGASGGRKYHCIEHTVEESAAVGNPTSGLEVIAIDIIGVFERKSAIGEAVSLGSGIDGDIVHSQWGICRAIGCA